MSVDFVIKLGPLYPPLARLLGQDWVAREISLPSHRGLGAGTTNPVAKGVAGE